MLCTKLTDIHFFDLDKVLISTKQFINVFNKGSLILGQESDGIHYGGFFDVMQSFSGELSQVEMWNIALWQSDIQKIAFCNVKSVKESNRVLSWFSSSEWTQQNVVLKEISLELLCEIDPEANRLIWLDVISNIDFMEMCNKIGGMLPIMSGNSPNEATLIHMEYLQLLKNYYDLAKDTCFHDKSNIAIWMGNQRNPLGTWYNPYVQNQTMLLSNVRDRSLNCLLIVSDRAEDASCNSMFLCGVCIIPEDKVYYLKGLCEQDIKNLYDVKYYIHGIKNRRPYFR